VINTAEMVKTVDDMKEYTKQKVDFAAVTVGGITGFDVFIHYLNETVGAMAGIASLVWLCLRIRKILKEDQKQ